MPPPQPKYTSQNPALIRVKHAEMVHVALACRVDTYSGTNCLKTAKLYWNSIKMIFQNIVLYCTS